MTDSLACYFNDIKRYKVLDKETLNELWDTAYRQIEISETRLDNH